MSSGIDIKDEERLVLQDRLNYPFLLASQILNFTRATSVPDDEYSHERIIDHILTLKNMIPESWAATDTKYQEDLKKAIKIQWIDDRPQWCGVRVGRSNPRPLLRWDYYRLFNAVINLCDRRHILTRVMFTEEATGRTIEEDQKRLEEKGIEIQVKTSSINLVKTPDKTAPVELGKEPRPQG